MPLRAHFWGPPSARLFRESSRIPAVPRLLQGATGLERVMRTRDTALPLLADVPVLHETRFEGDPSEMSITEKSSSTSSRTGAAPPFVQTSGRNSPFGEIDVNQQTLSALAHATVGAKRTFVAVPRSTCTPACPHEHSEATTLAGSADGQQGAQEEAAQRRALARTLKARGHVGHHVVALASGCEFSTDARHHEKVQPHGRACLVAHSPRQMC